MIRVISILKYSKILILSVLFFRMLSLSSQEKEGYWYYDSLTYSHYENSDWESLKKSSREALRKDLDYYYLRMRAAIAFYETANYRIAEKHFKKALGWNEIDPVSREYIYYSMLFAGKNKEASLFYKKNEQFLKDKVVSKNKPVRDLYLDIAYHINLKKDIKTLFVPESFTGISGYQTVTRNFFYGSFLLRHDITRYFTFSHGGTLLRKNNYYFSVTPERTLDSDDHHINQNQYYANLSFYPGGGFNLNSSIHFINVVSPELIYRERGFGNLYSIPGINENYLLYRFSARKHLGLFTTGAGISFSNLNNRDQFQKDVHLIFFPLGNRDLYTVTSLYHISDKTVVGEDSHFTFQQNAGFKLAENFWAEIRYWNGKLKNLAINEGFVIYNGNETVTSRIELGLIVPLDKVSIQLNTSYLKYYTTFTDSGFNETAFNKLNFNSLTILAELKWSL